MMLRTARSQLLFVALAVVVVIKLAANPTFAFRPATTRTTNTPAGIGNTATNSRGGGSSPSRGSATPWVKRTRSRRGSEPRPIIKY